MDRLVFISLRLSLFALCVRCSLLDIRQTQNGPVEGFERTSSLGQKYYSFRGIPFAEAPITGIDPYTGEQVDRRFKAPEPLRFRWTDVFKAHNFGKWCTPKTDVQPNSSEDCLFLNIHMPVNGTKQKTVLVFIHGGAFNFGDSTDKYYGPDFLLSQDNIVVTLQYRLGIFGFLNLNYSDYTGNMGLKDQQLALKWIHANIEQFSGNRNEILLFGESAGGVSVHFQMLNTESRKYFQRAFAISGSAFNSFAIRRADHLKLIQNCSKSEDTDKLIEYLKTSNRIALSNCHSDKFWDSTYPVWMPTVEESDAKGAFLTQSIEEIYNSPGAQIMDSMFMMMSQETLPYHESLLKDTDPLIKDNEIKSEFKSPFRDFTKAAYPKEYDRAVNKLYEAYFPDATDIAAVKRANIDLMSALYFNYGLLKAVVYQSKANHKAINGFGPKNTFLTRFNVTADLNIRNIWSQTKYHDAAHGDVMCYLFHCHILDKVQIYDDHLARQDLIYDIIMRSVKMITNFARTGDPSIEGDTPFKSCQSMDEIFCQEISNEPKTQVTNNIMKQLHYDVWHDIEEIYEKKITSGQSRVQFYIFNSNAWMPLFVCVLFYVFAY